MECSCNGKEKEAEANNFAEKILMSHQQEKECIKNGSFQKDAASKNAELIAETETLITELTRETRNNGATAKKIEDAGYDLKAVNPQPKNGSR